MSVTSPEVQKVQNAFAKDGWYPRDWTVMTSTTWGVSGVNSEGRRIYYLHGNAYQMGYMLGTLAASEIESMCTTYIRRLLPSFLSPELDGKMNANTLDKPMSDFLLHMSDWVVAECSKMIDAAWPLYLEHMPTFIDELRGLRDGASASGAQGVSIDRLLGINALPDMLMLKLNGGEAQSSFLSFLRNKGFTEAEASLKKLLAASKDSHPNSEAPASLDEALLKNTPLGCNSWGIKDPDGVVSMCRDFQLPNGGVYQDLSCIIIRDSRDAGGCLCFFGGAPGLIGGTTGMKYDGNRYLAVGVNILRSQLQGGCGLPALGIIHTLVSRSNIWTTDDAHKAVIKIPRSAAWTYPVCTDTNAIAIETGASFDIPSSTCIRFAENCVSSSLCRAVLATNLPKDAFRKTDVEQGVASRSLSYKDPKWLPSVNTALFNAFGYRNRIPFSDEHVFDPADFLANTKLTHEGMELGNNYFVPSRSRDNLLVTSNDSIIPLMRLFQMSKGAMDGQALTSKAVQWRYDRAVRFGRAAAEKRAPSRTSLEDVVSFLSPEHFMETGQRQYWPSKDPEDPLAALVEGNMNIIRAGPKMVGDEKRENIVLGECAFGHKAGMFKNHFNWVSCAGYL